MTRHEPTAAAQASQIEARVGRLFRVPLPTPATSGYNWSPRFDENIFKLIGRRHSVSGGRMGAAGKTEFRFRPVRSGTYRIAFEMARPWEEKAARSREVTVHVTD